MDKATQMVKKNGDIGKITNQLVDFLSQHISVERLILFGSYVYGKPDRDSDFDIAVISDDFERMNVLEKIKLFAKASIAVDSRIELLGFSRKDYLNPEAASMLNMIKKKGKILFKGAKK